MAFLLNYQAKRLILGRCLASQSVASPQLLTSAPQISAPQHRPFSTKTKQTEEEKIVVVEDPLINQAVEHAAKRDRKKLKEDFMDLTKFKLSLLNSVGAYTMFFYHAPLASVGFLPSAAFIFATQTIAMSSQCFGQVKEADKDALMVRTRNRPIPKNGISSKAGCYIGTGLSVLSFIAYAQFAPYTWVISNAVWFSYLCIYIPMKQQSSWNTFVGAIVGALPPLIGTMAQTGSIYSPETALLAAYIFSWQFPHFYGILYENKDDYKRAGFKMISNEDPTGVRASRQIEACSIFNSIIPIAMSYTGMIHPAFMVPFLYYQGQYMQSVYQFRNEQATPQAAKKLKRKAYAPFIILLTGFMLTTAYKRQQKRKENALLLESPAPVVESSQQ